MSEGGFTVFSDSDLRRYLEEFAGHILYACEIVHAPNDQLEYSINLFSKANFEAHEAKMEYLKRYADVPLVSGLISKVEKRIKEFQPSKSVDSSV